jgi:hypothetical protein
MGQGRCGKWRGKRRPQSRRLSRVASVASVHIRCLAAWGRWRSKRGAFKCNINLYHRIEGRLRRFCTFAVWLRAADGDLTGDPPCSSPRTRATSTQEEEPRRLSRLCTFAVLLRMAQRWWAGLVARRARCASPSRGHLALLALLALAHLALLALLALALLALAL